MHYATVGRYVLKGTCIKENHTFELYLKVTGIFTFQCDRIEKKKIEYPRASVYAEGGWISKRDCFALQTKRSFSCG